ncbi:hypothetical protein EV139_0606 [Leucobacter luti]|uniref:Uncharacterized protein n=2 Tax=Leucobacter luti TaxID=340320 RepID=A0A4Q7U5I2_9MICO|nr:hypothetical protein [Leucobacter luti]RZT68875.1 hypothetical protein EV139_0606 [Leucobacter luti]
MAAAAFAPAPAAHAAPQPVTAPADTAEVWLDLEGDAAAAAAVTLSVQQGAGWLDAAAARTPAGIGASFPASAGALDARFTTDRAVTADLAITFAAADGTIIEDAVHRAVRLDPADAGMDGWITLETVLGGGSDGGTDGSSEGGSDGASDGGSGTDSDTDSGTAAPAATNGGTLSQTGGAAPVALIVGALALFGAGAALAISARRRTSGGQNSGVDA